MARSGPVSVLDSRSLDGSTKIVRDRITRHQSPGRYSMQSLNDEDFNVTYRIPQPYRTSFSATHSVEKIGGRSRSLSPASSLRSGKSGKYGRSRSKSPNPKRVTYDTRVTIRHSNTGDSMFTELSAQDFDSSSCNPYTFSKTSRGNYGKNLNQSLLSADSGIDYSSELRDISQQICKMEWPSRNSADKTSPPQHGILKDCQNAKKAVSLSQLAQSATKSSNIGNKENSPSSASYETPKHKTNISKEYSYDRTISYRMAMHEQPSEEMRKLAEAMLEEKADDETVRTERSNSMPSKNYVHGDRLSPSKRSVSSSISNFFRKISPHMNRKSSREQPSKAGSPASGSSTSLTPSDVSDDGHFSRNNVRQSFLKFINRSKSRSRSRDPEKSSPGSKENHGGTRTHGDSSPPNNKQLMPNSTNRMLKSIERNTLSDKDVYAKFKDKQSPSRTGEVTSGGPKPFTARPTELGVGDRISDTSPSPEEYPVTLQQSVTSSDVWKPEPPTSLDVVPPKVMAALQMSVMSTISGDESIGECSLDANLTASEPSLLSGSSRTSQTGSKQVVLSQDLVNSTEGQFLSDSASSRRVPDKGYNSSPLTESNKENAVPSSPVSAPGCQHSDTSLRDPSRKPSYLKLSCMVSGYGKYSQYTSYKNIEKRSPFSSTTSLRSDESSPDMPSVRSPPSDKCLRIPPVSLPVTANGSLVNGHSKLTVYPTGDSVKDGEYFLQATNIEIERLQSFCNRAEADMSCTLSEEACGRMRSAIGKANLLIKKKFEQFRELCHQHMHPDVNEKETKWEDLQGFWDMVKIQVDSVEDSFAEIELMRQNGWREVPQQVTSRRSSTSSSPKSGSLSQSSTPCHTPGSKRKGLKAKDTPDSSPERTQKAKQAAKARDDARKKILADKRAAMKQKKENKEVEIYLPENGKN
ncbi:disks large-associated protein 4-like [Gigantopelta aegis]|uniref:disks large-associated protein 4-like n=1 Tax=Gigantopelta aegis TaxID=1735272 RepID=UPI001B88835F|nr:disks large-associated protein 4-like [Gigantopelta aegis]XP_041371915.1 disks large-associated protein 4-like [Gigantopelta aegis]